MIAKLIEKIDTFIQSHDHCPAVRDGWMCRGAKCVAGCPAKKKHKYENDK